MEYITLPISGDTVTILFVFLLFLALSSTAVLDISLLLLYEDWGRRQKDPGIPAIAMTAGAMSLCFGFASANIAPWTW